MKTRRITGTDALHQASDTHLKEQQGQFNGQVFRAPRQRPSSKLAPGLPPRRNQPLKPRRRPAQNGNNLDPDSNDSGDQGGIGALPDDLRAQFHELDKRRNTRLPQPDDDQSADGQFGQAGGEAGGQQALQRPHDDDGTRRRTLGSFQPQGGFDAPAQQKESKPSSARPVQYARPSPQQIPQQLLQMGLPGAAELFGPKNTAPTAPRPLLDALMSLLIAAAGARTEPNRAMPSLTSITLAAVQAHLSRQPADAPALTLGHVKEMLIARSRTELQTGALPAATAQRIENALLLMPLLALNTSRPRTPDQHLLAQDRLALVRGSSAV